MLNAFTVMLSAGQEEEGVKKKKDSSDSLVSKVMQSAVSVMQ